MAKKAWEKIGESFPLSTGHALKRTPAAKKRYEKMGIVFPFKKGTLKRVLEVGVPSKKPFLSVKTGIARMPRITSPHELPWWRPEGAPPRGEALGPSLGV